jgi:hypothetical protein
MRIRGVVWFSLVWFDKIPHVLTRLCFDVFVLVLLRTVFALFLRSRKANWRETPANILFFWWERRRRHGYIEGKRTASLQRIIAQLDGSTRTGLHGHNIIYTFIYTTKKWLCSELTFWEPKATRRTNERNVPPVLLWQVVGMLTLPGRYSAKRVGRQTQRIG